MPAKETIRAYYDAFNRQDMEAFFDLLHDDVIHDINQGGRQVGKDAATPTIVFQAPNGKITVVQDDGSDKAAFAAAFRAGAK